MRRNTEDLFTYTYEQTHVNMQDTLEKNTKEQYSVLRLMEMTIWFLIRYEMKQNEDQNKESIRTQ